MVIPEMLPRPMKSLFSFSRVIPSRRWLFCQALVSSWFVGVIARAAVEVWFSPAGASGHSVPEHGFSQSDPHQFDWKWVKEVVLTDAQPDRSAVLNFLPGVHSNVYIGDVEDFTWSPNQRPNFTLEPGRWRITIQGTDPQAEKTVLMFPSQFWLGDNGYCGIIELTGDAQKRIDYARIVVQNLTLDGNWDNQKFSGPEYLGSYKMQPLRFFARTARVRNVIVRNYGAHNSVPETTVTPAGCETFPIFITSADVGQEPEDGDPRPIVVEDCELDGLRSVYGGYCSTIAVNARVNREKTKPNYLPEVFSTDPNRRLILVRRNQIRGYNPIAFGSSGGRSSQARGVTFTGNVILGAGIIMNNDTGVISYVDVTNNIGLGVGGILNHGWVLTEFKYGHHHYQVTGNAIRFRGPWTFPVYRNYTFLNSVPVTKDKELVLGRLDTNPVAGVIFAGASSDTTIAGNWFTTEPPSVFNRIVGPAAGFRVIRKYENQEYIGESWPSFPRSPSGNVALRKNALSKVAYDFSGMLPIEEQVEYPTLTASSAKLHAQLRGALPLSPDGFIPAGKVERVSLVTSNRTTTFSWLASNSTVERQIPRAMSIPGDRITVGALEVSLGVPEWTNDFLRVPARVVVQPSTIIPRRPTLPVSARMVILETWINQMPWALQRVLSGSNGVARFSIPVRQTNALVQFRAWVDAGQGREGSFDEYQDAWATSFWTKGSVVWVTMERDIARWVNGQRGRLIFHRTGTPEQLSRPLSVRVAFDSSKPKAAASGDYRLFPVDGAKWTGRDSENVGLVSFSPGMDEAIVEVAATEPGGKDNRVLYVSIQSSPADAYVVG